MYHFRLHFHQRWRRSPNEQPRAKWSKDRLEVNDHEDGSELSDEISEEDAPCLFCGEMWSDTKQDSMIRCTGCQQWAHTNCADDVDDYVCDLWVKGTRYPIIGLMQFSEWWKKTLQTTILFYLCFQPKLFLKAEKDFLLMTILLYFYLQQALKIAITIIMWCSFM